MDCEQALLGISAAFDGELTEFERAALKQHLKDCPSCRAKSEELGALSAALSDWTEQPPEELTARIRNAVAANAAEHPRTPSARREGWKKWGTLAAMCAVVLCLGVLTAQFGGASRSDSHATNTTASLGKRVESNCATVGDTVGEADAESGEVETAVEVYSFAPEPVIAADESASNAVERVFWLLGGTESYPNAVWEDNGTGCLLEEYAEDARTVRVGLRATGYSEDGAYYTVQLYRETTDDTVASFTVLQSYAVSLDGSEVLSENN